MKHKLHKDRRSFVKWALTGQRTGTQLDHKRTKKAGIYKHGRNT